MTDCAKDPQTTAPITFILDQNDVIVDTSPNWDSFAADNGGEDLLNAKVIGTNIYDHVDGDITRMFLESLIQATRLCGTSRSRDYRCDSPTERRWMIMTLEPHDDGRLSFTHEILRTEPTTRRLNFKVQPSANTNLLKRCSMCNAVEVNKEWVESDQAAETLALPDDEKVAVIYGVCPTCLEKQYF